MCYFFPSFTKSPKCFYCSSAAGKQAVLRNKAVYINNTIRGKSIYVNKYRRGDWHIDSFSLNFSSSAAYKSGEKRQSTLSFVPVWSNLPVKKVDTN